MLVLLPMLERTHITKMWNLLMRNRTCITMKKLFPHTMRTHIVYPYVSETYECFHLWHARPWSLLSFFSKEEWKVAKEEVAGR